jgi:hypothetical protein
MLHCLLLLIIKFLLIPNRTILVEPENVDKHLLFKPLCMIPERTTVQVLKWAWEGLCLRFVFNLTTLTRKQTANDCLTVNIHNLRERYCHNSNYCSNFERRYWVKSLKPEKSNATAEIRTGTFTNASQRRCVLSQRVLEKNIGWPKTTLAAVTAVDWYVLF